MSQSFVPGVANRVEPRKSQLSAAQRRLVELISRVHFGKIESLHVRNGQPIFAPHPRVTRTLKVGGVGGDADRNEPRPQGLGDSDFVLKSAVVELLAHLQLLNDGVVERIQIANGLPLLLEVCDPVTA
jgi:hypothetical protein